MGWEVVLHVKTQEGGGGGCPTCEDTGRGGGEEEYAQ